MRFNLVPTERVLRASQHDRIDDLVAFDLSGEKRPIVQFLVREFHSSVICQRLNPLVAHSAPPSDDSVEVTQLAPGRRGRATQIDLENVTLLVDSVSSLIHLAGL